MVIIVGFIVGCEFFSRRNVFIFLWGDDVKIKFVNWRVLFVIIYSFYFI